MDITISGKQVDLTEDMKDVIISKISRLDKYFNKETPVQITVSNFKNQSKIEATIPVVGGTVMRAEGVDYDLYTAIDQVVSRLGRQLRKHKTKLMSRDNESIRFENVEKYHGVDKSEGKIVKRKSFVFDYMDEEEAVLQMELLNHNFYIFRNAVTDRVNLIYKRRDKNYGLIEEEV